MLHLTLEDLARLADEAPLPKEAAHLRDCLVCRRELEAMRDQTAALAELPVRAPSDAAWLALERRLLEEGLMRAPAPGVRRPVAWPVLRIAAALALFVGGTAVGARVWNRTPPAAGGVAALPAASVMDPTPLPAAYTGTADQPQGLPDGGAGAVLASNMERGPEPRPASRPRSPAVRQAERELAEAQAAYLAALRRYGELADPASGADPVTRLEALDRLVEMSGRALERAPDDPQLNGYHMAALNERDALRRQVQQASQTTWF